MAPVIANLRPKIERMFLKLSKALWAVSVLCVFANLLYVYASLPPEQVLVQETPQGNVYLSREVIFYISLLFILTVNVLVFIISAIQKQDESFRGWFYGLVLTLNIFTILALSALSVINSNEKYDFSRLTSFLYGSLGLILLWSLTWPLWALFQKKIAKD
jgi:uncharacterized membrane protein YkvI